MRILLSAYACEPGKGSEPEVGFRTMLAVAEKHSVWVLTRRNNVPALSDALRNHPHRSKISIIGFDLSDRALMLKKLTRRFGMLWYYDRWQKAIEEIATKLDREHSFDLVHHITLAAYWGRVGAAAVGKPLIVGPVGGAATTPLMLLPILGAAGVIGELSRRLIRPLVARLTGGLRAQKGAAAVISQNRETARAIRNSEPIVVLPNGLVGARPEDLEPCKRSGEPRFIFAGRLVAWKAPLLAIRALGHYPSATASLEFYGTGGMRRRLHKEAKRMQLTDRVIFHGPVPRQSLLNELSTCTALIHPALHEESGLVVAEALSVGTPVVCLDWAGPPIVASYWPEQMSRAIRPASPRKTAVALAEALSETPHVVGKPDWSPARQFTDQILALYEDVGSESDA